MTEVVREPEAEASSEPKVAGTDATVDDQLVGMLVERAPAEGLQLTGEGRTI